MKLRLLIVSLLVSAAVSAQKPAQKWLDQKFSMFIHFGLYSQYGGVYNGKPVEWGYSEQIQSFAGIFSDWYAESAKTFNPAKWNPDEIVALAKSAGMRSIVITSKHHDGFCMYHSRHTKFNIVDATPYKRDLMKELAEACRRGGIDFAVYYSLIDWNFPQAYPISSHNADPITPEHYQFNLKQVEEIMTNYGAVSEIWFDMGSLTLEQSKGLYELVNRLQPQCMISGRLGNNYVDFGVMPDNEYPDYKLSVPWQTAASMFDETWGYRSWQKRGSVREKTDEKIASLIRVVSRGGNYLLNIGPRGDGSVVEFEKEVLEKMGEWTKANAEAIYGAKANPLTHSAKWGDMTINGNNLYLFIKKGFSEKYILLNGISGKIKSAKVLATNDNCNFYYPKMTYQPYSIEIPTGNRDVFQVIKVEFEGNFTVAPANVVKNNLLSAANASGEFGHSSMDYYCGYKSLTAYNWNFQTRKKEIAPTLSFTENEAGKVAQVDIDGKSEEIRLLPASEYVRKTTNKSSGIAFGKLYTKKGKGVFGTLEEENRNTVDLSGWKEVEDFRYGQQLTMPLEQRESVLFLQEIESPAEQRSAVEIGSGNAVYILLNGQYITAHFMPERLDYQKETVVLPLKKGKNLLIIKYFNRFADALNYSIAPVSEWTVYQLKLPAFKLNNQPAHQFSIRAAQPDSKVSPLRMNNIEVRL